MGSSFCIHCCPPLTPQPTRLPGSRFPKDFKLSSASKPFPKPPTFMEPLPLFFTWLTSTLQSSSDHRHFLITSARSVSCLGDSPPYLQSIPLAHRYHHTDLTHSPSDRDLLENRDCDSPCWYLQPLAHHLAQSQPSVEVPPEELLPILRAVILKGRYKTPESLGGPFRKS